jgi:hypothetical protein
MLIPIISRVYIGILEVEFRFSYIYLVFWYEGFLKLSVVISYISELREDFLRKEGCKESVFSLITSIFLERFSILFYLSIALALLLFGRNLGID